MTENIVPIKKIKKVESLTTTVYHKMRNDILDGNLKAGKKLGIKHLQDLYEVGNSPIREALSTLIPEGLVVREDGKGFTVQILNKQDLTEITQMRCWLENFAIREAIRLGDNDWEESIVIAKHRLSREPRHLEDDENVSNPRWEQFHDEFHSSLIAACGSKLLFSNCKNLRDLAERYRRNGIQIFNKTRRDIDEHSEIMDAVLKRNADLASDLLVKHIEKTKDLIIDSLPNV